MKRIYETVVIFDGSLPDETITKEQEKVENFLSKNAELEKIDVWGKKKLAYEIKKKKNGFYCLFIFKGKSDICRKINKFFKLNQKVLRHMTVLHEKIPELPEKIIEPEDNIKEEGIDKYDS